MTVTVDGQRYEVLEESASYYIVRSPIGTIAAFEKTKVTEEGWVDVTADVTVNRDTLLHQGVEVTEANGYRRVQELDGKGRGVIRIEQRP